MLGFRLGVLTRTASHQQAQRTNVACTTRLNARVPQAPCAGDSLHRSHEAKPGPSSQPSAMHRAPNAAERSQVPCNARPCKPVLCAVPVGAHVPLVLYLICIPSALSAHAILSPTVSLPSLTFLSHVTNCLSAVLPVLAYSIPACAPYSAELSRLGVSTYVRRI